MELTVDILRGMSALISIVVFIGGAGHLLAKVSRMGKDIAKIFDALDNGIKAAVVEGAASNKATRDEVSNIKGWLSDVATKVDRNNEKLVRLEERSKQRRNGD